MDERPPRTASLERPATAAGQHASQARSSETRRRALAFALVFAAALGIRLLCRSYVRGEVGAVQTAVTENYKQQARLLVENGIASFFDPGSATNDPELLGHPPGYPFVLALVYEVFGESDTAAQVLQIICDSLAAALVLLVAAELLPFGAAVVAGALAAVAPQFCWNCVLLLPDTLAVLPVLFAVLLLLRADKGHALLKALAAGALVGLSCWLRANALLLAPFTALAAVPFLFARGERVRVSLALVAGAVLAVAPLTIRNAVVFGHFIPVSLGAGQTLVEGVGDYDPEQKFGLPDTDVELQRQEAEAHGRPEYASSLFSPDGIERDRERTRRALSVMGAHPFRFAGVMVRRAASMLRLERVPLASDAPVSAGRPRLALRAAQKVFITAVFLPLYALGLLLLAHARRTRALAALLAVPLYYLCVQSALHTEYRYVLAVHYFLFIAAAAGLYHIARAAATRLKLQRASR
jgi:4-amino-4-deoxy-L-arabinose transferase-like glycosyltransferase